MTFSIVGRCERTGELGVALASASIAIGNRCPRVRAGVGAVVVQNAAAPDLAVEALDFLQSGLGPTSTLNLLTEGRLHIEYRQLLIVDNEGRTGHFAGDQTEHPHAVCEGSNAVAGGCDLSSVTIPSAMIVAFEQNVDQHLAWRLIRALEAGLSQVSEDHRVHSAALLVAREQKWPHIDLRVDWHQSAPVEVLRGLWDAYRVQADSNVMLACNPGPATGSF